MPRQQALDARDKSTKSIGRQRRYGSHTRFSYDGSATVVEYQIEPDQIISLIEQRRRVLAIGDYVCREISNDLSRTIWRWTSIRSRLS